MDSQNVSINDMESDGYSAKPIIRGPLSEDAESALRSPRPNQRPSPIARLLLAEVDYLRGQLAAVDIRRTMIQTELDDALRYRPERYSPEPIIANLIAAAKVWAERRNYVEKAAPGNRYAGAKTLLVAADKVLREAVVALDAPSTAEPPWCKGGNATCNSECCPIGCHGGCRVGALAGESS